MTDGVVPLTRQPRPVPRLARGALGWLPVWFVVCGLVMGRGGILLALLPAANVLTVAMIILLWPRGQLPVGGALLAALDGLAIAWAIKGAGCLGNVSLWIVAGASLCFASGWLALWLVQRRSAGAVVEFGEAAAGGLVRRTTAVGVLLMFLGGAAGVAATGSRLAPKQKTYQEGIERLLRDEVFATPQPLTWEPGRGHWLNPGLGRMGAYVREADRGKYICSGGDYLIRLEALPLTPSRRSPDPGMLWAEVRVSFGKRCLSPRKGAYTPEALVALGLLRPEFARAIQPDPYAYTSKGFYAGRGKVHGREVLFQGLDSEVGLTIAGPLP